MTNNATLRIVAVNITTIRNSMMRKVAELVSYGAGGVPTTLSSKDVPKPSDYSLTMEQFGADKADSAQNDKMFNPQIPEQPVTPVRAPDRIAPNRPTPTTPGEQNIQQLQEQQRQLRNNMNDPNMTPEQRRQILQQIAELNKKIMNMKDKTPVGWDPISTGR